MLRDQDRPDLTEAIVETVHEPLLVLDADLRVTLVNPAFCEAFGVRREETLGKSLFELAASRQEAESRFRALFANTSDAICFSDGAGRLLEVNDPWLELFGATRGEVSFLNATDLYADARDREALREVLAARHSVRDWEVELRRVDGRTITCLVTANRHVEPDGSVLYQSIVRDVTERRQLEKELERRALHDWLTGLPNRALLRDRLQQAIRAARRDRERLAVLFLDLDRFKRVNDDLGHAAGDRVLLRLARRLRSLVRERDSVARMGGDEFVVLIEGQAEAADVDDAAARLLAGMRQPVTVDGHEIVVTFSIGSSTFERGSEEEVPVEDAADELVRRADLAMYRAKSGGGDRHVRYDPSIDRRGEGRVEAEAALRRALTAGEVWPAYQPVVDLRTGVVRALEILARWTHPERGPVPVEEFLPLAEEAGLTGRLTETLLERACGDVARLEPTGEPLRLLVNVSGRQAEDAGLPDRLRHLLEKERLDPSRLDCEVTEATILHGRETLQRLRGLGVRVALDDFGQGYSSLRHLKELPVDVLKIDAEFVAGIGLDPRDEAIVRAVIGLGGEIGLDVVAEGVETAEQAEFLRAHGCPLAQGFYFAPPLALEALGPWLGRHGGGNGSPPQPK